MNSSHAEMDGPVATLIRSQQALQSDPDNAAAHFEQALALCQLGKWEQAVAAWEQVVRLEPDNAFAYINMGVVYLEQGQWTRAEQAFRQALRCQPSQPAAHYGLGMAYAHQGRQDEAQAAWERTLQLEPDHRDAQTNLAVLRTLAAEEFASTPVECVVTSQVNLLATPENMEMEEARADEAAQDTETGKAETERRPQSREERLGLQDPPVQQAQRAGLVDTPAPTSEVHDRPRIKLPPVVGPSLASIAGTVIAAQHQPAPDSAPRQPANPASHQSAVGGDGNAAGGEQDRVEPTLRLDAKSLQKGHRALSRQQQAGTRRFMPGRNLLAGGAVGVSLLLSAAWGVQQNRAHHQSSVTADTASAAARLPTAANPVVTGNDTTASAALQAGSVSSAPPDDSHSVSAPSAALPAAPDTAPDNPAAARSAAQAGVVFGAAPGEEALPRPHSRRRSRHSRAASENDAARSDQAAVVHTHRPRAGTGRIGRGDQTDSSPASKRLASSRRETTAKHASGIRHNTGVEEDTFASHAQPKHSDSSEGWTDKIPQ